MAKYPSNAAVSSVGVTWESWPPRAEGQDARAGDQRTVLEMWLSADVGIDSREDDTPPPETLFSLVEID
jgi:hypothetical protein